MVIQEKLYTVDDLWAMESDPAYENRYFYLIDGILYEDDVPSRPHGVIAVKIAVQLELYNTEHNLGEVTVEVGFHHPESRYTAMLPDVAFQRFEQVPDPPPQGYVPQMPDLAVEIQSPRDSLKKLRHKAEAYLKNGTPLVWLVQPKRKGVEVLRLVEDEGIQADFHGLGDRLSGEDILPGFELDLSKLFAAVRD